MSEEARVADLVEAFLDLKRLGRAPGREAFAEQHPDVASRLLEALEGLAAVEDAARRVRDEPLAGKTIGEYRIAREIGRGGMGVVYEAEDTTLHRRVALKVLPAAALLDPRHLQRFRHEAQAAAQLHHGNIVPVYGVGSSGGLHYYAMQYIDGTDLGTVLQELREGARGREPRTPLSSQSHRTKRYLDAVCRLGIQAAEALDHAHQVGVVHRDVKPANLLVDVSGHLWVTDFGLAQFERGSAVTRTGDLVGTFRYMSPEQAKGKRLPIDHRTDVYSLGATLYELATLEPVVGGEDPQEVLQGVWGREPVPPRRHNAAVPAELETILLKAIAKDPHERYETALALAEDLRRFLDDRPIAARAPSLAHRARKWARRHRGLVGAAVMLLVLAVAGFATSTVVISREKARAEEQTRVALDQSALAEKNYGLARDAVDRMLTHLGEEAGKVPGLEPLRRTLLEEALGFYEQFLAEREGDPKVRWTVAQAHRRMALALKELGKHEQAVTHLRSALAAFAEAKDTNPLVLEETIAICHDSLADLLSTMGQDREAEEEYRTAYEAWTRQVAGRPGVPAIHVNAAGTARDLGILLANTGRAAEAIEWQRRAVDHLSAAAPAPGAPSLAGERGKALSQLGIALEKAGRPEEGEPFFRQAIDLQAGEVLAAPTDTGRRHDLAETLNYLGQRPLQAEPGSTLARALEASCEREVHMETGFEAAREIWRVLARDSPDVPAHAECYGIASYNVGVELDKAERAAEAEQVWVEARDTLERLEDYRPETRLVLGKVYDALGDVWATKGLVTEAEAAFRRSVQLLRERDGIEERDALFRALSRYARLLVALERFGEAGDALLEAQAALRGICAANPQDLGHRTGLVEAEDRGATTLEQAGRAAEAIESARNALEDCEALVRDFPDHKEFLGWLAIAYRRLAGLLDRSGDTAGAAEVYANGAERFRGLDDPGCRYDLARILVNWTELLGRHGPCEAAREKSAEAAEILRALPPEPPVLHMLGLTLLNLGSSLNDPGEAAVVFGEAVGTLRKLRDATGSVPQELGAAHALQVFRLKAAGRDADAIAACRGWLADLPDDGGGHEMLAWILATAQDEALRDPKAAVEHAQIGVDHAPGKGEAWRNLGVARYRAGDWKGAVEAIEKAISLGTADDGLFFLAMAEARLGEREKAQATFAKAVAWHDAHPDDRELPRFRAEAEKVLGGGTSD